MDKMALDIGFAKLIAEIYHSGGASEMLIYLCDKETELIIQDIVLVRSVEDIEKSVECLVWSDKYTEDYSHRFVIGLYEDSSCN